VRDGYLCRPVTRNIPLKIDLRKIKLSSTPGGMDLDLGQICERISPLIREIARNLALEARHHKTVVFMPSVETAKQLASALSDEGMNSKFVSGECSDRKEKIEWFRQAGRGSIICNAQLITRGFDVRDITAVCVLRPSRIWSFVVQCWLRGSRILPNIIDGLATAEQRRNAIERSPKSFFTIFDFLWLADRIDIVNPVDLIATKPEIRQAMIASGIDDLMASQELAHRDFLKALAAAARKHALKQARTIDPMAYAVSLGDDAISSYTPENKWEMDKATPGQIDFLRRQGLETEGIKSKGLANRLITRVMARMRMHLATPRQLDLLRKLGLTEQQSATLSMKEASATIDALIAERKMNLEPVLQEFD
jgi:type I site-specific restriction endonuclease